MKVLRINTITSTGQKVDDTPILFHPLIDPATGQPYLDDAGEPSVEVRLRPISRDRERELFKACTEHKVVAGAMAEVTDYELLRDERTVFAVTSWKGFIGADDKPLPCTDATKRALDYILKNQIVDLVTRAQPVEVSAASFRQLPPVPGVVGGLGNEDDLLSTGDAGGAAGGAGPVRLQ